MTYRPDTGGCAAAMAVLRKHGPGVGLTCHQIAAESGLSSSAISGLLKGHIDAGRVIKTGERRSTVYKLVALSGFVCRSCGQDKPTEGSRRIMGTGLCCAECAEELRPMPLPVSKRGQRSPEGRPPAESKAPWRPANAGRPLSEPALPAGHADLPPGVKVTVRLAPPGRFEAAPDFRGGFTAEWEMLRHGGRA